MQAIGLLGETLIYFNLASTHSILRGSILRFIWFDSAGLVLLSLAFLLVRKINDLMIPGDKS